MSSALNYNFKEGDTIRIHGFSNKDLYSFLNNKEAVIKRAAEYRDKPTYKLEVEGFKRHFYIHQENTQTEETWQKNQKQKEDLRPTQPSSVGTAESSPPHPEEGSLTTSL